MYEFLTFKSRSSLAGALSKRLTEHLSDRITTAGKASIAVSGGATPLPLFHAMRRTPLAWQNVNICLVDERWVPPTHARSNEKFIRSELLVEKASAASFTGMWQDTAEPVAALQEADRRYRDLACPFDAILLGMGSDGHTASLFRDAKGIDVAFDLARLNTCAAIEAKRSNITGEETRRMTLTARAIKEARLSILMITGEDKKQIFEQSLEAQDMAPIGRLTALLDSPLQVYWAA